MDHFLSNIQLFFVLTVKHLILLYQENWIKQKHILNKNGVKFHQDFYSILYFKPYLIQKMWETMIFFIFFI